jgi:hypothetical protein
MKEGRGSLIWRPMRRPAIPDNIRVTMVALGICLLIVAVGTFWSWLGWQKTEGTVEVSQVVEYGLTNTRTRVAYTRANGAQTYVFSSDGIPASVRNGERLPVLYDPERGKNAVVYSFDTVWSIPVYTSLLGVVITSLALFARSRRRVVFIESHANAER